MTVAKAIHDARKSKGLSQDELAKVTGVHRVTIARIETGGGYDVETIAALCSFLGLSMDTLLKPRRKSA